MGNLERSSAFRPLVEAVEAEFAARGIPLKPGAAADLLRAHVERVAAQMGSTPTRALRYFTVESIQQMARATVRTLKEHEARQAELPPVTLDAEQAGLVVAVFAATARLGIVNGDPDVAADLCEVITAIGVALRELDLEVPALLLGNGLAWATLCADKLSSGIWTALPGAPRPTEDSALAAALRRDLDAIGTLLPR